MKIANWIQAIFNFHFAIFNFQFEVGGIGSDIQNGQ